MGSRFDGPVRKRGWRLSSAAQLSRAGATAFPAPTPIPVFPVACNLEATDQAAAATLCLPPPAARRNCSSTRRNLWISTADGLACSVMVGIGETYLPAFALALGTGQVVAGLIASVPIFAGAVLQLVSPTAIRWLGSNRRWVVGCVAVQAFSFLPLVATALIGSISTPLLFLLAALYWGSGMASGPAWNHWIDTLVPARIRARYMGRRSRFTQAGILCGFAGGGLALEFGNAMGRPLWAFAVLFLMAAICRFISAGFLFAQGDPLRSTAATGSTGALGSTAASPGAGLQDAVGRLRGTRDGRLLVYLWGIQMAAQVASPFYAPFMLGLLKFSYLKYMLIVSVALVTKAVAVPTFGRLAHRFGARRLLSLGGLGVIPLAALWIVSQSTCFLVAIQIISGACWAAYELGSLLMCFEAVDHHQRIGMLTLYNLGFAAATVAGALCGGTVLALFGQQRIGYFAMFGLSSLARLATAPLLARIGAADRKEDLAKEGLPKEDPAVDAELQMGIIKILPAPMASEDLSAEQAA